jgi:hypothetical protein
MSVDQLLYVLALLLALAAAVSWPWPRTGRVHLGWLAVAALAAAAATSWTIG